MRVKLTKSRIIYLIAILNSFFLIICYGEHLTYDTTSYVNAWDLSLSKGQIDIFRTPIYPIFLAFCRSFSTTNFYTICIIVQHIIFLLSVVYFKRFASLLIESEKTVQWITLIYAIIPATATWSNCILTESLAISGTVFLLYSTLFYYKQQRLSYLVWSIVWLTFLVFLRPAFLYLLPIYFIFAIILICKHKKSAKNFVSGIISIMIMIISYCGLYKSHYGVFAPSCVSAINYSYLAFHDGLMRPEFTDNKEYKDYIKNFNGEDPGLQIGSIIYQYGLIDVQSSIQKSQHTYPIDWIKKAGGRLFRSSNTAFLAAYAGPVKITDMIGLNLNTLYLFLFVYLIVLLFILFQQKTVCLISSFLWFLIVGNAFTAIVGAQAEWGRLIIPSFPIALIMIGQISNFVMIKSSTNNIDILS